MTPGRITRALAAAVAFVAIAAGAAALRMGLAPEASRIGQIRDPSWLPDGKFLRIVSFGQRLTLADIYWLRCVIYVGEGVLKPERGWSALYPLSNIVTDLDPRFGYAYQVMGSNLSGIAGLVAESDELLQKGMRNVPDRWSLPFVYAVNKFLYENDYREAAVYARRAAEVGHRPHLALLAANLSLVADRDDEYRIAEQFLEESIEQAGTPELKEQLADRLLKVRTYAVLSRLEKAIAAFRERSGRFPETLRELVQEGLLPEIPADPSSGVFRYDRSTGSVESSALGLRKPFRVK